MQQFFKWLPEHEQILTLLNKDSATISLMHFLSDYYTFHINANSSNIRSSCDLIQELPDRKGMIYTILRVFDIVEQNMSLQH